MLRPCKKLRSKLSDIFTVIQNIILYSVYKEPRNGMPATCLSTRLEESSLIPAGFLTAQFLQKLYFIKPLFFWGENGWYLSLGSSWRKGEVLQN